MELSNMKGNKKSKKKKYNHLKLLKELILDQAKANILIPSSQVHIQENAKAIDLDKGGTQKCPEQFDFVGIEIKKETENVHEGVEENDSINDEQNHEKIKPKLKRKNVHQCQYCEKLFRKNYNLRLHVNNVHKRIKKHECELCKMKFSDSSNLKRHLNACKGLKNFRCEECEKMFSTKQNLERHIKIIHQGLKNYKCDICDKVFGRSDRLKEHEKTQEHQNMELKLKNNTKCSNLKVPIKRVYEEIEKVLKCKHCDETFPSNKLRFIHMKSVHEDIKRHMCNFCEKSFCSSYYLNIHVRNEHGIEDCYKCNLCEETFVQKVNLRIHKKTVHETIQCMFCANTFAKYTGLVITKIF